MAAVGFYIVKGIWFLMSLLPLKVLYFISDLLFYPIYYLARYRRKVVHKNMTNSFPEKSVAEIKKMEKEFYHSLCDYFVETMKLYGMSKEEVRRRIEFTGLEKVNECLDNGKSVVVYMAHSFNWEYATSIPLWFKHENVVVGQIYHPLENKQFDDFFQKLRNQYGSENIAMKSTLRRIVDITKQKQQFIIGFIADQVPTWNEIHHWVDFMNQDTPVFTGTEKIAKRTDSAVFYLHVRRVKRGKYNAHFEFMVDNAASLPDNELTNMYYKLLEDGIRKQPNMWLWTHNRWKRTRQGWIERQQKRLEERKRAAQ
ncbi:MAG: lysophospholipid acyltransferase family protein [Bacteroidaceae bacterium]|nr:lysophospholipid acyltransferase family protein [Bacteroidaceae bacterium]